MRIWDKYLKCKEYAEKKQITQRTNEQWNFYNDKQWEGLESGGEILPFFNFIKPICRYKVATICSNNMTANYSDLMGIKSVRGWWRGNVGKSDFERLNDVLAWMPLPEPYREDNN